MKNHSTSLCYAFFKSLPLLLKRATHCLAFAFGFGLFLFAASGTAWAQTKIYMHQSGTVTVSHGNDILFYDEGGPSSGPANYWDCFYTHGTSYTMTFQPAAGDIIQVTFNQQTCYAGGDGEEHGIGMWAVRLNDDFLRIYDGATADNSNLIAELTGSIRESFTVTAHGPMTFSFSADGQYREEGWYATVKSIDESNAATYTPQPPIPLKEVCGTSIELLAKQGYSVYYTTDGNDPTNDPSMLYSGSFDIGTQLNALANNDAFITVKAVSYYGSNPGPVSSTKFYRMDRVPDPATPTISINGTTVVMTAPPVEDGINETYDVYYTTDLSDPSSSSTAILYSGPFEWYTPNTTFKAYARARSCSDKHSGIVEATLESVKVPTPVITFDNSGVATITCSMSAATIYYTINGSTPSSTNNAGSGTSSVTSIALTPGTTVKAIAVNSATGYTDSEIASKVYIPEGGNGVYGGIVLLDDREDHSWSYYSDDSQPIHRLNPADVKITYYGNGTNNMTTTDETNLPTTFNADATNVAVSHNDPEDTFVYLKTLENANEDGSGNYPYTMIPNPFQVRPVYIIGSRDNSDATPRGNNGIAATEYPENFNDVEATAYNNATINLPDSWYSNKAGTNTQAPRVSSYAANNNSVINNLDGNYLLMSAARGGNNNYAFAITPQYGGTTEAITAVTFRYRFSNASYGSIEVRSSSDGTSFGNNAIRTINTSSTNSSSWQTCTLSNEEIATINNNGGRIAFVFRGRNTNGSTYYHGAIDNLVVTVAPKHTVHTSGISGGTVSATPSQPAEGSTVTLTITPSSGNRLNSITVTGNTTGNTIALSGSGNTRTFTMPNEDVTVHATFFNPSTGYRGFYAWRVKSKSASLTIKDAASSTTYDEDAIIYADQNIEFITSNEYDNEVEFEALWAQAYVTTGTGTMSSYASNGTGTYANYKNAYERNFHVVTSANQTASNYQKTYPVTITSRYPEGTSAGGSLAAGNFTAAADTKFENINLGTSTTNTYTGNGYNLTFGRGIAGTVNRVMGKPTTDGTTEVSNAIAYTIRLESGTINNFDMLNNTGGVFKSTLQLKAVFGNDYDRANNIDNALKIMPSGTDGTVYGKSNTNDGNKLCLNSETNRNSLTFDWYVKSGTIHEEKLGTGNGGTQSIYLGSPTGNNDIKYAGKRRITMEGGNMASIAGGVNNAKTADDDHYSTYAVNDGDPTVMIRMKGGTVRGAIYGGGERGGASGDVRLVITGGAVNSWIAGGANGTQTSGGELYGDTYIYVGGNVEIGSSAGGNHVGGSTGTGTSYGTNGADGGHIFGAGCGILANTGGASYTSDSYSVGRVNHSNVVVADQAQVWGNVYGGGNYGRVRAAGAEGGVSDLTDPYSKIYILGGEIKAPTATGRQGEGNVFGGSNRNKGQWVYITMKGGTIKGNIYGGSNEWGTINHEANITMSGGVATNVFGGGFGEETLMKESTTLVIDGGTVTNNVYGGGEQGEVGTSYLSASTSVTFKKGTVNNVFGAGKGETGVPATVNGPTSVTIEGGTVNGDVFGGGENGNVAKGYATPGTPGNSVLYDCESGVPSGWNATGWTQNDFNHTPGGSHSLRASNSTSTSNWLITSKVLLGNSISFYCKGNPSYPNEGRIEVYVSTGGNNQSDFVNRIGGPFQTLSGDWPDSPTTIEIPSQYVNQEVYIAFKQYGASDDGYTFIDDITFVDPAIPASDPIDLASTVTVAGGEVMGTVFGGGMMGTVDGNITVNILDGQVHGDVFGGALGAQGEVFVAGTHTVNVTGGHVYGNLYGGSKRADDALTFSPGAFSESIETSNVCVTNISGGRLDRNVYGAGFFGQTFGSVQVFIGQNAIQNAPNHAPTTGITYTPSNLRVGRSVWAGSDWGVFSGEFGAPTISGYSNIYVDGTGYDISGNNASGPTYINISESLLGCGTSCDAGKQGRTIIVRNYGEDMAGSGTGVAPGEVTRTLYSIQRADKVVFDNAHVNFFGQGRVNSDVTTEKFGIYGVDECVFVTNGSSLFFDAPVTQIMKMGSYTCGDVYADVPSTLVTTSTLSATPNKIRVSGGNYLKVYHDKMIETAGTPPTYSPGYGELAGFAYLITYSGSQENALVYARPKWCQDYPIAPTYNNEDDGGWVSYDSSKNVYDLAGKSESSDPKVQMAYENHVNTSRNGEEYFRIWRDGGNISYREGVINAIADGGNTFSTADAVIDLPTRANGSYYRFEVVSGAGVPNINYGADVLTFNAAMENSNWMYYNETTHQQVSGEDPTDPNNATLHAAYNAILQNPNTNFGLVVLPTQGFSSSADNYIICAESDPLLIANGTKFAIDKTQGEPHVTFRLTYSNTLESNASYDPITIIMCQYDAGDNLLDRVRIALKVNTVTPIENVQSTDLYAIMRGTGEVNDTYTAKVTLPSFVVFDPERYANFKLKSVQFTGMNENETESTNQGVLVGKDYVFNDGHNQFSVTVQAAANSDFTNGWEDMYAAKDAYDYVGAVATDVIGTTTGRQRIAFDFTLRYDGSQTVSYPKGKMGQLTFNLEFDNYKKQKTNVSGEPLYYDSDHNETTAVTDNPVYIEITNQPVKIMVDVYRRGRTRFYVDGVYGKPSNSGEYPDQAVHSLAALKHLGYMPGDEVYIVNTITIDNSDEVSGGTEGMTLFRYPGGHEMSNGLVDGGPDYTGTEPTIGPGPGVHTGTMLNVTGTLKLDNVTIDGGSANATPIAATAPLITVSNGATVELLDGVVLQNNKNTTTNGGAVAVAEGGTLMMNNTTITDNSAAQGGGVYMEGTMIVSGDMQIDGNTASDGTTANNVYLASATSVIQIGTHAAGDNYGALDSGSSIGVTKTASAGGYIEVVTVEDANDVAWLDAPLNSSPNSIIFHDGGTNTLVTGPDPQSLYWLGGVRTWTDAVTSVPTDDDNDESTPYTFSPTDIHTSEELAWIISVVTGANGATVDEDIDVVITADIDMSAYDWVPIGDDTHSYAGTFDGGGHTITGLHNDQLDDYAGLFGVTEAATIQNVVVEANFTGAGDGTALGTIVGAMGGGTLDNCGGNGTLVGTGTNQYIGGLVGYAGTYDDGTVEHSASIHSCYAVVNITGGGTFSSLGGLVGTIGGIGSGNNLYNSFANPSFTVTGGTPYVGGLVGQNYATVENCYSRLRGDEPANFGWFAGYNEANASINYCYAPVDKTNYVGVPDKDINDDDTYGILTGLGNYAATALVNGKYGYNHSDQQITPADANSYVVNGTLSDQTEGELKGLLATLNSWVAGHTGYTPWTRTMASPINDDYPVHKMAASNSVGSRNGVSLYYDANVNDLYAILGTSGAMYMYDAQPVISPATTPDPVSITGNTNVPLYINENVGITQADDAQLTARVGVTFDNSDGSNLGGKNYDWHMFSTPLSDASRGINYGYTTAYGFGHDVQDGNITLTSQGYFPTNTPFASFDYYAYDEPSRHWINFKRKSDDHWHQTAHTQISYDNEDVVIPGKGYLMAVDKTTMLMADGTLNNGAVTNQAVKYTTTTDPSDAALTGVNLVGNPYQSYLNMSEFMGQNADNVDVDAYYVIDADAGKYLVHPNTGSTNPLYAPAYLHPHQGFLVSVKEPEGSTPKTVTFNNTMRSAAGEADSYFRGEKVNYPLVNLICTDASGRSDLTTVEMNRPELGGARKLKKMRTGDASLYAHFADNGYQALFAPKGVREVPVRLDVASDGVYTITWSMFNGEFHYVHLIDNMTGADIDMLTNNEYRIEASTEDYTSRFRLIFDVTGENDSDDDANNGFIPENFAFFDGNSWVVTGQGTLQLFDVNGRCLMSTNVEGAQSSVSLPNVAAGVYMFRLSNSQNSQVQKVVVK